MVTFICCACVNDPADVAGLRDQLSDKVEAADSIRIIFSDSGMVRAIIEAPVMMNYLEKSDQRQEFLMACTPPFTTTSTILPAHWWPSGGCTAAVTGT